jgi:polysaccharide pyruvyl transferase WcaK-like protein
VRYFVYGYYGYANFGDDLLLRGLIEGIRVRDTNARFFVHSFGVVPGYTDDVKFTGLARQLQNVRHRPWRLATYVLGFSRWLSRSDVLVIGGGTLFIDKGRFNLSLALLYLGVLLAQIMRKRVVVVGVGVDRLTHPISRWLTHRILGAAEFVAVREALSLPYVAHRSAGTTRLSADLALALDIPPAHMRLQRPKPTIGACFIDYFRTVESSETSHAAYTAAIVRLIERYRNEFEFACITFQRGVGQRDDWLVPLWHELYPEGRVIHVDSFESACQMAGAVDILLSTRFHLGLLGVIWGKPVVIIDHELKLASLASDFALPSISLAAFIAGTDIDLRSLLDRHDPERTAACLATQRGRAALNFEWLTMTKTLNA